MPTFHQPDDEDRRRAESTDAETAGLPDLGDQVEELRELRPSSEHSPTAPDRPRT